LNKFWLPLLLAIVLSIGILTGIRLSNKDKLHATLLNMQPDKFQTILNYISANYVDTLNADKVGEQTYADLFKHLDPHSVYIPANNLAQVNESLEGNFDGIGIEFFVLNDTLMVLNVIPKGPSEKAGLMNGDKILAIDDTIVAGKKITNEQIIKKLRGPKSSKVQVTIQRMLQPKLLKIMIERGEIPIRSIDAAYMVTKDIGYIKINRFAKETYQEFMENFDDLLNKQKMKTIIIDLRQNGGGYLDAATNLLDEFIDEKKMLVYTNGRTSGKKEYKALKDGMFEKGKIVLLVDEGSASASEIMAGALQDWDRASIVGRRTFGKGLVQEQYELKDGSAIRLTVARYYTPSGRCIQKTYANGYEDYENELFQRYKHGELQNQDSIKYQDTVKYKTASGRIVYGGGGIMPDYFVAFDTLENNNALIHTLLNKNLITTFSYNYFYTNAAILKKSTSMADFDTQFQVNETILNQFWSYCTKQKVDNKLIASFQSKSKLFIQHQIKANLARQLWGFKGYIYVINNKDKAFKKAVEVAIKN
jgi:carboxyl-terminal processing protease